MFRTHPAVVLRHLFTKQVYFLCLFMSPTKQKFTFLTVCMSAVQCMGNLPSFIHVMWWWNSIYERSAGSDDAVHAKPWASVHLWASVCLRSAPKKHVQRAPEVPKQPTDRRPVSAGAHVLTSVTGLWAAAELQFESHAVLKRKNDHTYFLFSVSKLIQYIRQLVWNVASSRNFLKYIVHN